MINNDIGHHLKQLLFLLHREKILIFSMDFPLVIK